MCFIGLSNEVDIAYTSEKIEVKSLLYFIVLWG